MKMAGVVQAAAQSAGGPNLQELDETGSQEPESEGFFVKEFFWDKIIVLLTTSIIGLTALDILTELLRGGSGVVCFIPEDLNLSDDQSDYLNGFCSRSVPDAQYLPIFVLIHGILIAAWHYIWKSSFSSQFDYFFSLASHLVRFRDEVSGEYPVKNLRIINRLETEFCTYRKSGILRWYQVKLVLQILTAVGSILLSFLLFNDFNVDFTCKWRDPNNGTITDVPCIFASLRLFFLVRIFDTILLGLIIIVALLAFLWTFVRHTTELGYNRVAKFSFCGGINPEHYLPKSLLSAKGIVRLFVPMMKNDFDFLLMALYKTDSGLAHIFKEGLVEREKNSLFEAENRYLTTYQFVDEENDPAFVDKKMAPRWIVPAKTSFSTVDTTESIVLPNDIAGAVMGMGIRSPGNKLALCVSFGSHGFAPAVARVFNIVASFNFDPSYKNKDDPIIATKLPSNLTLFHCHQDVFSLGIEENRKFTDSTEEWIWREGHKADYLVVGPVQSTEHLSVVTKLVTRFQYYFTDKAILLVVVPKEIEGKKTKFISFKPPSKLFEALPHSVAVSPTRLKWPPSTSTRSSHSTKTFPLICGSASCIFDLLLYGFLSVEEESDVSESSDSSVEEDPTEKEDKMPLLDEGTELVEKGGSNLTKKRLNTAVSTDVEIVMEP